MTATGSETFTLTMSGDREVVMTRALDAPRALVFEAHSSCEHVSRWWGRRGDTMASCEMDFRAGGRWRYALRGADGAEFGFRGEYREVTPVERITWTFEFEGFPGHASVETISFDERDGKTFATARSVFDSAEDRDGMVASGMEGGARETWDRLDELLAALS